jgi:hypothetical protein
MKIYLAGSEFFGPILKKGGAKNCLFSFYAYFRYSRRKSALRSLDKYITENKGMDLFMDSGGYSAFSCGAEIDIDLYCKVIKQYEKKLIVYAQLDVIGDPEKTRENLEYMESKGLSPLPVFHYGSDFDILRELAQKYDYIALGGLVPYSKRKPRLKQHLDTCFAIIQDQCRVHGFGMTGMEILQRYPWYSVDSTGWLGGSKRAEYHSFERGKLKFKNTKVKDDASLQSIPLMQKEKRDGSWKLRSTDCVKQWLKVEKYITDLWTKRGIIYE